MNGWKVNKTTTSILSSDLLVSVAKQLILAIGYLFWLLAQLCSDYKWTAQALERNQAETSSSWWSRFDCYAPYHSSIVGSTYVQMTRAKGGMPHCFSSWPMCKSTLRFLGHFFDLRTVFLLFLISSFWCVVLGFLLVPLVLLTLAIGPFQGHKELRSCVYSGVASPLLGAGITSGLSDPALAPLPE